MRCNEQGKLDEAVAQYQQALALKPDFAEAHNNLGIALRDQGKLDEAVAQYRRALALNSRYGETYGNLGLALMERETSLRRWKPFSAASKSGSSENARHSLFSV